MLIGRLFLIPLTPRVSLRRYIITRPPFLVGYCPSLLWSSLLCVTVLLSLETLTGGLPVGPNSGHYKPPFLPSRSRVYGPPIKKRSLRLLKKFLLTDTPLPVLRIIYGLITLLKQKFRSHLNWYKNVLLAPGTTPSLPYECISS